MIVVYRISLIVLFYCFSDIFVNFDGTRSPTSPFSQLSIVWLQENDTTIMYDLPEESLNTTVENRDTILSFNVDKNAWGNYRIVTNLFNKVSNWTFTHNVEVEQQMHNVAIIPEFTFVEVGQVCMSSYLNSYSMTN